MKRLSIVLLVLMSTVAWLRSNALLASARPGGGSSFSGGSRSSSSSSRSSGSSSSRSSSSSGSHSSGSSSYGGSSTSSDDFGLIGFLLSTGIGGFGFVGFVIFVMVLAAVMKSQAGRLNWDAGTAEPETPRERIRPLLEQIRADDPNFSVVLLEDFLYALYAQAHTLRGEGALERLSSHMRPAAREAMTALGPVRGVRSIIVGAMRFLSVDGVRPGASVVRLGVEFESNYSETPDGRAEQSFYARETWTLSRARGVLSRTPDRARVFVCPSCGAPLDTMAGGRCQYCQTAVDTGQFDWVVEAIAMTERETRGPLLTGTTEEKGTDRPTVVDRDLTARFAELTRRDPTFVWPAFQAKVAMIFAAMQTSWSNREWAEVRPFVSDNLFQMLAYWIDAYKKERLRNVTEAAHIERIELARITSDKFFDALTVRLFATSFDYTITDGEPPRVVAGSRQKQRRYSEYWTLIRSAGKTGAARADASCPSCGAPLRIEMSGHCEYCRAKVTSGEFDWVLSRIEQDDVYDG
jgi:Tim44-like domain